jgi:hypothetical protein
MSRRAWKGAFLVLYIGVSFAKTGAASCAADVGKARADRMQMHCERVNFSSPTSCAAVDCLTIASLVQAFCATPHGRPTLCGEYPALVLSKPTGIPPDLERIAATAAEDRQVTSGSAGRMRDTVTLVTTLAASVKTSKAKVVAERQSFTQRTTAASAARKRYKADVDSKSAPQLAEAPKLLEAARTEFAAASSVGESLIKHTAELREYERQLGAALRGADNIALAINRYAEDAKNAALVMNDALVTGAKADGDAMARVKALRDQVTDGAKEAEKAATEATGLARKAHTVAELGPGYDWKEAESQAAADDEALKKKVDEVKHALSALSGTSGNLCDKQMLERMWKASGSPRAAHAEGLVPVVLHTLDAKTLGEACPFLKATIAPAGAPKSPPAGASGTGNVELGFVPFADLGLEILVLVESGPKCGPRGCGYTLFVNEGAGFTRASSGLITTELVGFARKGVDIFAELSDAEWKLQKTPGKPSEFVFSRPR